MPFFSFQVNKNIKQSGVLTGWNESSNPVKFLCWEDPWSYSGEYSIVIRYQTLANICIFLSFPPPFNKYYLSLLVVHSETYIKLNRYKILTGTLGYHSGICTKQIYPIYQLCWNIWYPRGHSLLVKLPTKFHKMTSRYALVC